MSGRTIKSNTCTVCGGGSEWANACYNDFGPEWTYAGVTSCGECGVFNLGAYSLCRHVSYSGDIDTCCLGGDPGNRRTCDPELTPANGKCDNTYMRYCAEGDRIMSDPKCRNWANSRPEAAKELSFRYCATHLDDQRCKDWCSQAGGVCDSAVVNWCLSHPKDPYCGCIVSPLVDPKYGINPKCVDPKCIKGGYITRNMREANCPNITNCDVQANIINSGVDLAGITINQSCGSQAAKPSIPAASFDVGDPIFAFVVFLAVLLVLIFVLLDDDEDGGDAGGSYFIWPDIF